VDLGLFSVLFGFGRTCMAGAGMALGDLGLMGY